MSSCGTSARVKEGPLGLEVAGLQQAQDLFGQALAPMHQGQLGIGQGEIFGALEIVEVGQTVQRQPLGLGQNGEVFVAGAHRRRESQVGRMKGAGNFPYCGSNMESGNPRNEQSRGCQTR
jgi:hypothetical protein